ncbi:MAG: thioredoxin-like domain-containing protein [Acidimicrobiia bacterium]
MSRSPRIVLLVSLVLFASVAVVFANRRSSDVISESAAQAGAETTPVDLPVISGGAPAIVSPTWINSAPLAPADLAGKVVLYDFWTFGCINCQHTLPWVKSWNDRYGSDGLVVLSIHRPEFDYERDVDAVRSYVQDNAITFPVAIDNDAVNWKAFDNHYWPAFYLHDRQGDRRLVHFGEGRYQQTEDAIRTLLGVDPTSPRAAVQ